MERRRYERQVEFWVQGSNLEPSKQASRLMSGLSGRAEEAVQWLRARDVSSDAKFDPEDLDNGSGVGKLLQTTSYEDDSGSATGVSYREVLRLVPSLR